MAQGNQVTIVGNLTDDPELRFTPGGAAVATFTVAINSRKRDESGQWVDGETSFIRCNVWRDRGRGRECRSIARVGDRDDLQGGQVRQQQLWRLACVRRCVRWFERRRNGRRRAPVLGPEGLLTSTSHLLRCESGAA
jgi:hypothetical protein